MSDFVNINANVQIAFGLMMIAFLLTLILYSVSSKKPESGKSSGH